MSDHTPDELGAWKAQQEANREARLQQLYTPEELWRRRQQEIAELSRLRPASSRQESTQKKDN